MMSNAPNVRLSFTSTSPTFATAVQRSQDFVVVTARGAIDEANAESFAAFALSQMDRSKSLIVDLNRLDFFGTAGFSALHTIDVLCAGASVRWSVCAGWAVARVLRICDPAGALPVARTLESAKHLIERDEGQLLQLVAEPS